jgi:hypothetical protein
MIAINQNIVREVDHPGKVTISEQTEERKVSLEEMNRGSSANSSRPKTGL